MEGQTLAAEEEYEWFTELARTGDSELRDRLIVANLGLARQLARRFAHRGESAEDLVQVASLALVKAVDRFDPERGVRFSTFAVASIVGELKRHFRDRGWAVRAPRRVQELYLELAPMIDRLSQEYKRAPTVPELAAALDAPEDAVLEAMEAGRGYRTSSLDAHDRENQPLTELLGEEDGGYEGIEDRSLLSMALRQLGPRDQLVMRLRFVDGLTQSEIAGRLGVSQMQVSRLLAAGLARLRESVSVLDLGEPAPSAPRRRRRSAGGEPSSDGLEREAGAAG